MFWGPVKVNSWRKKLFKDPHKDGRATETVENMLSLTATLYRYHSDGAFALRPIQMSDDKKQLELEFHWLVVEHRQRKEKVDLLDEPLSSANLVRSGEGYGPFFRLDSEDDNKLTRLRSGFRFTLSTDDPVNKPLPDPGLLKLQWHLQRILAMSGASGWREEDFDDGEYDYGTDVAGWEEDFDNEDYDDGTDVANTTVEDWLDDLPNLSNDNSDKENCLE